MKSYKNYNYSCILSDNKKLCKHKPRNIHLKTNTSVIGFPFFLTSP